MTPLFGRGGGDAESRRERSAAERERDRQEREARRAAREGRQAPAGPPPAEEPPMLEEPPAEETETWVDAAPAPAPAQEPAPPPPSARAPLAWDDAAPAEHADDREHNGPEEHAVTVIGRPEEPIGTKRVAGSRFASAAGAEGPPRFGAPPHGMPRGRHGLRRIVPFVLIAVAVVAVWFLYSLFQPFKGDGSGTVRVTIPAGSGAGEIGDLLAARGVVDSGFFFSVRARLSGKRGELRSGPHVLKKGMSYGAAIDALTTVPAAPKTVKVTVPEGRSAREIVPLVRQAGLRGGYLHNTRDITLLNPRRYGAPKGTRTLEGFLWPATYEFKPRAQARRLVAQQVAAFKTNLARVDLRRARRKNLTRYDVVIIASMIEREAMVPKDRRLIAAVVYNRLHEHMPLGIDATIRYRLDNWTRPLTNTDLRVAGAYNTRTHTGLPPTPIGNPGLAALKAAANPANVSYLFYVVKPCGSGAHAFSSTDTEFQKDVAAYQKARADRGGKDPSRC